MGVSALELRRRVLMAQPHKERKTGSIVSFNTHVPQVLDVSVPLSPVQAGTGDPYPPGGGVNLIDVADITVTLDNQYYASGNLPLGFVPVPGETYTFSADVTTTEEPFSVSIGCGTTGYAKDVAYQNNNHNGRVSLTFAPTAEQLDGKPNLFIRIPRYGTPRTVTAEVKNFQLEKGATAHDFAPYSNIRPISGHTGAAVCRTGKNLLDLSWFASQTVNGVTFTKDDGQISISGTATGTINLNGQYFLLPPGTYTLSGSISNNQLYIYDASTNTVLVESVNGNVRTVTTTEQKTVYLRIRVGNGATVSGIAKPMLEPGATASEYAPYSGESFPVTFPAGCVNKWDEQWEVGAYNTSTGAKTGTSAGRIRSAGFIPVIPGSNYKAVGKVDGVCYYDKNKNYLSYSINNSVITIPDDCYFITFYSRTNYGSNYNRDISINNPASITVYIPHDQAIFGGRYEPGEGRLLIDRLSFSYTDGVNVYKSQSNRFYMLITGAERVDSSNQSTYAGVMCDRLKPTTWAGLAQDSGNVSCSPVWGAGVAFRDDRITTVDGWKEYLAENQMQFVFELAEPLIVPLTPAEIRALMGENNVFADAGDVDVEFWTN